jgi:hypothetical protein
MDRNQEDGRMKNEIRFTVYGPMAADGGYEETEHCMPAKMEVCPRCNGEGTHVAPGIDDNGITASEMDELGDDFREDYMSGHYDVTCTVCHGKNVVPVPDLTRASAAVKRAWKEHQKAEAEYQRDYESEAWLRRAESGERY